jgi:hypothetical protein
MADPSRYPDSKSDTTRRWIKVLVIIVLVVVLLVVVMLLVGGGEHGPSRHSGGDAPKVHRPPAGIHTPPAGIHPRP